MSGHVSAELLSCYLDGGLERGRADHVEEHVADCDRCRRDLEGLRRVVERLNTVERTVPPAALGFEVRRRVASEQVSGRLADRLQIRRGQVRPQLGLLAFLGPLLGLTVILFLFLQQVQRQQTWNDAVVIRHPGEAAAMLEPETRTIGETVYESRAGAWVQQGIDRAAVSRVIEVDIAGGPFGAEVLALRELGDVVVTTLEGVVVELRFAAEEPASPAAGGS